MDELKIKYIGGQQDEGNFRIEYSRIVCHTILILFSFSLKNTIEEII